MRLNVLGFQPNHNYISFRDAEGNEVAALHGFSIDRNSGFMAETALSGENTLRSVFHDGEKNQRYLAGYLEREFSDEVNAYKEASMSGDPERINAAHRKLSDHGPDSDAVITVNKPIWQGSPDEGRRLLASAMDASVFINDQNLKYSALRVIQESQNSNSVAHSLVKAMGLEFPEEQAGYAPGHDRTIEIPREGSIYRQAEVNGMVVHPVNYVRGIRSMEETVLNPLSISERVVAQNGQVSTYSHDNKAPLSSYNAHIGGDDSYDPNFNREDAEKYNAEIRKEYDRLQAPMAGVSLSGLKNESEETPPPQTEEEEDDYDFCDEDPYAQADYDAATGSIAAQGNEISAQTDQNQPALTQQCKIGMDM